MLRNKRKLWSGIVLTVFIAAVNAFSSYTEADTIYEEVKKQTITQGVTHENIIRFTTDGWYNFNILKIDLTNQFISVDTLTNKESIGKTATTKKLAEDRNAVAAINASFFNTTGSGNGFPVGAVVQSSDILSAYSSFNKYSDSMASFALDQNNNAFYDYWKINMEITSQSGAKVDVEQYNVANKNNYSKISVFDRKWGSVAIGATSEMPDIFQMVVENGIVTQFLEAQPAAAIPENGFVVVTRSEGAAKLKQAFSIGDAVTFNIYTTPDWTKFKMAVSGSSILVKNGVIPSTFSFTASDVVARSPKTAVGTSKDGKTLYLVTVDGRQTASIGLTLKDMAAFMKSIGAYNAINMDGGGSTTMVARPFGETGVKVLNNPSDGSARRVSTAIGVFTSAPKAELAGLIVETSDRYIFTNCTRAFTVKGYDKYYNPVEVDQSQVKWSVTGVKGTFKGNVFKPTTHGEGKIIAKIGDVEGSINISVLSRPVTISLSSKSIQLAVGQSKTFTIIGTNPRGYTARIEPQDLTWKVSSKIGTFKNGVFTATASGAGYIDASLGDVHAYCAVSVSSETVSVVDKFEKANGTFKSYPDTVAGSYSISSEQKVSGNSSGKLVYDFTTNTGVTRAAYMVLSNGGYVLEKGTTKIGLQVYNSHENSGWLRAELIDADGNTKLIDLAKPLNWVGWKYVETSIASIKMPAKLTRIYIALVNPENGEQLSDAGCLYFDDLTVTKNNYPSLDGLKVPQDTPFVDELNKSVKWTGATSDSFRFGVMGQSREPKNNIEKNLVKLFANKVNKYLEFGAVVGSGSHESITSLIKKPFIATHTVDLKSTKAVDYKYSVTDFKNSRFIKLDTRNKSLRTSDPGQWKRFLKDLESFKGKNVFIFMEESPNNFKDKLEADLFKKTISDYRLDTLRNVWVFYKGSKNECRVENGVRYFETAGYEVSGLTAKNTNAAKYVLVTVKGSDVTYVYKPINS